MHCPKCQCDEISPAGMCLWCGCQVSGQDAAFDPSIGENGKEPGKTRTGLGHAPDEPGREELPQWRQELSQRLRSIKKKREISKNKIQAQSAPRPDPNAILRTSPPEEAISAASQGPELDSFPASRTQARTSRRRTSQKGDPQAEAPSADAPELENNSSSATQPRDLDPMLKPFDLNAGPEGAENLFSGQFREPEAADGPEKIFKSSQDAANQKQWMILLYRSLSGLLDLLIIALIGFVLVLSAAAFSGIRIMRSPNYVFYALLFLLVYFTYSLFFLGISNQTIGMMLSNLKLVGTGEKRPHVGNIVLRSGAFLVSFSCACAGLIWAIFDRDHQCLHDRITKTRVVCTSK